jgi:hypothetical protein
VTARLSKAFYDQFGEQVTNELVDWFNAVDLTYRNDLRALNDTNFARFEAVLEARFAAADLQLEKRFAAVDLQLEKRFRQVDTRFEQMEARIGRVELNVQRTLLQQTRWMMGMWMTNLLGILAVLVTLLRQGG